MDDVSRFSINYNLIRVPHKNTDNILSYAAKISIKINGKVYLEDDDFAILDFALALKEWRKSMRQDLNYYPMDDEVMFIRFICDKNNYIIEFSHDNMLFQFQSEHSVLITAIDEFLSVFNNDLKKYKDRLSRYNYTIS